MDFTNAYTHILSLIGGETNTLLYSYSYHGGLIETYISNMPVKNKNFINIYLIVTDLSNKTESLKSIAITEKDGKYHMHGYWPHLSFGNVYAILQTNRSITPFLKDWIERMENVSFKTMVQVDKYTAHKRVSHVASENNKSAPKDADLNIYPLSLHKRIINPRTNQYQKISASQREKIVMHFGYDGLNSLEQSMFTIHFTNDPLKQKTINLLDLPKGRPNSINGN